jgi:hypothetical protein
MKTTTAKTDALERLQDGIARLTSSEDWLSYLRSSLGSTATAPTTACSSPCRCLRLHRSRAIPPLAGTGSSSPQGCQGSADSGSLQVPHHHHRGD